MTTSEGAARTSVSRTGLLARHPLIFFFVMAFAFAWIVEAPLVLSETGTGILPFTLPKVVQALSVAAATYVGPTVSAFVMTGVTEGRAGIRRLLRRYVLCRVQFRWYAFVLLLIPAVEVLGAIAVPGPRRRINRSRRR